MRIARDFFIVLVTTPDMKTARRLAHAALGAKLVACANLVPTVESHYRWRGKLERSHEALMILKATRHALPKLEELILKLHPYDTTEFVVIELRQGNKRYLNWVAESCAQRDQRR